MIQDPIQWVYPQSDAIIYEASTLVLGSVDLEVDALFLNGDAVPLYLPEGAHSLEKSFALTWPLKEGLQDLSLETNRGERITRLITRKPAWTFSEADTLLFPVHPTLAYPLRLLRGEAFAVEVRVRADVQQVWVHLLDEGGRILNKTPLRCEHAFVLNPKSPTGGEKTPIFADLHYDAQHPPLDKNIQLFKGQFTLTDSALAHLPDGSLLRLGYCIEQTTTPTQTLYLGQELILWQYPRTVEVTASSEALYQGASPQGQRLLMRPALHSLLPVVGLGAVDEFYIRSRPSQRYCLKGGKPTPHIGEASPQYLGTFTVRENEQAIETLIPLTHATGMILHPTSHALAVELFPLHLGLQQARYLNDSPFQWQASMEANTVDLKSAVDWSGFKGMETAWRNEGLCLRLLKQKKEWSSLRIVLDPGHGGLETGTHALNGLPEKIWTLSFAKRLQEALQETGLGHVALTREEDETRSLKERQWKVQDLQADICLSIHANALPDGRDPVLFQGVSVHTATPWSQGLGDVLYQHLTQNAPKDGRFISNFAMTRLPTCASVLIEYGYFIHPTDYHRLLDESVMGQMVHTTVDALHAYVHSL